MLPQLEASYRALQEGRAELWAEVEAMAPEVRAKPLREGAWTPLQQIDHVVLVEQAALAYLRSGRDPGRRTLKTRAFHLALRTFFALGLKAKAPTSKVLPGEAPELDELGRRWEETRQGLEAYLEGVSLPTLRQPVFRHPYVGPMDLPDALNFLHVHLRHHRRQVASAR